MQPQHHQQILSGENYDNEQDFQIYAQNTSSNQDIFFDQVVAALQQIIVDDKFQQLQTKFMKQHCQIFENTQQNKLQYMTIFKKYNDLIQKHIEKSLYQMIPGFQMNKFLQVLQSRTEQIDQQILEILQSFTDFQIFKGLILDYKSYYQEEERLKSLTIKSNKIPQNKKVKGNSNIFYTNNELFVANNNKLQPLKKKQIKEKTQEELLLPDFVLTIRPLRKA